MSNYKIIEKGYKSNCSTNGSLTLKDLIINIYIYIYIYIYIQLFYNYVLHDSFFAVVVL